MSLLRGRVRSVSGSCRWALMFNSLGSRADFATTGRNMPWSGRFWHRRPCRRPITTPAFPSIDTWSPPASLPHRSRAKRFVNVMICNVQSRNPTSRAPQGIHFRLCRTSQRSPCPCSPSPIPCSHVCHPKARRNDAYCLKTAQTPVVQTPMSLLIMATPGPQTYLSASPLHQFRMQELSQYSYRQTSHRPV